jgi:transcriptional regulator with XRE-family HTH domain
MKALRDIAGALRARTAAQRLTQAQLRESAGIAQRTLTNVLSGREDFKVSTLLALCDRLGLEMVLVPTEAAKALEAGQPTQPTVTTRVAAALQKLPSYSPTKR